MLIFSFFLFPAAHGAISDPTNADVSISPPPAQNETARQFYNAGTEKLRAGKLADAETLLESSLAKQDERVQPAALFNLGDVRFDQGIEELKKSPDGAVKRTDSAIDIGTGAIAKATDALASNDVQQMVDAYLAGRGAQKEMRAATQAVQRALEAHGRTLLKWRGALGDFQSAAELNPADTNAAQNAEFAEQSIAKLVDSLREMQQAAASLSGKQAELNGLLQQLKGKIPAPNAPPGGDGEDDNPGQNGDHPLPESLKGLTESAGGGGHEMDLKISPDEAGQLLNSIQPDGKNLPLGGNEPGQPNARSGRIW
jgi:hypothetical protein